MPIDLGINAPNIATGWGPPPQLSAPSIGTLVGEILRNKLLRDKMTGENIADTIRNVRGEMQSNKYLDAMKAAGLISQDYDAGGMGGAKLGTGLAKMIQDQNELAERKRHQEAMEGYAGRRLDIAEDWAGGSDGVTHALGEMWIDDATGLRMIQTKSGPRPVQQYAQPDIVPQKQAGEEQASGAYSAAGELEKQAQERKRILEERFGPPSDQGVLPQAAGGGFGAERRAKAQQKYDNWLKAQLEAERRKKELEGKFPGLMPGAGGQGGGERKSAYASPDEIKRARARQALDDPNATPAEKEQARIILSQ